VVRALLLPNMKTTEASLPFPLVCPIGLSAVGYWPGTATAHKLDSMADAALCGFLAADSPKSRPTGIDRFLLTLRRALLSRMRLVEHQVVSGEFEPRNILAVTFTTKAADELAERLCRLGAPGVPAKTFHAAALLQLTVLGARNCDVLPSTYGLVKAAAQTLPAEYRRQAPVDLVNEIEKAKNRRVWGCLLTARATQSQVSPSGACGFESRSRHTNSCGTRRYRRRACSPWEQAVP
jgi:hypothetical protein